MSLRARLQTLRQLGSHLGWRWLAFRGAYAFQQRSGWLERRFPAQPWAEAPLARWLRPGVPADPADYVRYRSARPVPFFFSPDAIPPYRSALAKIQGSSQGRLLAEAAALGQGSFRYFEHDDVALGWPPDWHYDPKNAYHWPTTRHWARINAFEGTGDIKLIWEPSRFAGAFKLARAYWATGDERYPQTFWALIDSWRQNNPPQLGVNWLDGQELALRVLAWVFALYGFGASPYSTPEKITDLVQMIAFHADHIAGNIALARSMQNNHVLTEAAGLWTVGLIFPELRDAERWAELGRKTLIAEGLQQIYPDGAYAQHSFNYQRLMLHDYLWALRLGQLHGRPFPDALIERVGRAGEFLYQVQDEATGYAPNYGANDGALILPLATCDYRDYRPVLQAIYYLYRGQRLYESGAWDEPLLWFWGPDALTTSAAPTPRGNLRADIGGYYTQRTPSGFTMTRCASFRHRPTHADMLHVDLWWRGQNIALDAGAYSYHAPAPWDNALAHTAYHNTVSVDGCDQMGRAGRFLWLPWLRGRMIARCESPSGGIAYWEGEHDGYRRLRSPVLHRRGVVRLGEETWLVLDSLQSTSPHRYRLHWLLADAPYTWNAERNRLQLNTSSGPYIVQTALLARESRSSLARADESSPRGWQAPYYHDRKPALSLELTATTEYAIFYTIFGSAPGDVSEQGHVLTFEEQEWRASVQLTATEGQTLVTSVSTEGNWKDILQPCISF